MALRTAFVGLRGVCTTLPWILHLFLADVALSVLLPVSALFPTAAYNLASTLAGSVWQGIQDIFTRTNRAKITVSGSSLPPGESAVVVANHLAWTDFYMIQHLAQETGMLGRCRWFAKQQLKWVPFLGWGLWAMGMPLVSRNWVRDRTELNQVFGKIIKHQWPIWLISYSEATRYSKKKHDETVKWCMANNRPVPQHTLYPRTKGFIATVNELRKAPHVKAVYDCTICYAYDDKFQVTPSFWGSLSEPNFDSHWRFHVHVERHLLEHLPQSDQELAQWLEKRWIEKGERLEDMRARLAKGLPWE